MNIPQIDNAALWRLGIELSGDRLTAVLTSSVADSSMRLVHVPLPPEGDLHHRLEEAVYSAPWLLADYGKVDIVVRTADYTLIPCGDDCADSAADICRIGDDSTESHIVRDTTAVADAVWSMPASALAFIRRTFPAATLQCHISPLLSFFAGRTTMGNTAKLFAHFDSGDHIDIAVFSADGKLLAAATHSCPTDVDAVFYILSTARLAGLDADADEVLLCGNAPRRMSAAPILSRYIRRAMPLIFPSQALRSGREAFNAPFPVVILPLCE